MPCRGGGGAGAPAARLRRRDVTDVVRAAGLGTSGVDGWCWGHPTPGWRGAGRGGAGGGVGEFWRRQVMLGAPNSRAARGGAGGCAPSRPVIDDSCVAAAQVWRHRITELPGARRSPPSPCEASRHGRSARHRHARSGSASSRGLRPVRCGCTLGNRKSFGAPPAQPHRWSAPNTPRDGISQRPMGYARKTWKGRHLPGVAPTTSTLGPQPESRPHVRAVHRQGPTGGRPRARRGEDAQPQLHRDRAHPARPDPRG